MLVYLFRCFFQMCGIHYIHEYKITRRRHYYWKQIQVFVTIRSIIVYWMEQTQINLCKEGGKGRLEDFCMFHIFSETANSHCS